MASTTTTASLPNCRDLQINKDISDRACAGTSVVTSSVAVEEVCLGMADVFVALFLVVLVVLAIVGNLLVILSVAIYRRMRTFTNVLLVSLGTADLCVGVLIMPIAVVTQLQQHKWTFGRLVCQLWASADVLLCTASILNLCVISLDRYFAITSPLRYTRTRSHKLAAGIVLAVWLLSVVICSPPLLVPEWHFPLEPDTCDYAKAVPYRVYSALGSFYIPLFVMLFVYYKIFRVASSREQMLNIDRRGSRSMQMWRRKKGDSVTSSAVRSGPLRSLQLSSMAIAQYHIMQPNLTTDDGRLDQNAVGGLPGQEAVSAASTSVMNTSNVALNCIGQQQNVGRGGAAAGSGGGGGNLKRMKIQNSFDVDQIEYLGVGGGSNKSSSKSSATKDPANKKHVTIVEGDNLVPLLTETAKEYFEKTVPWTLVNTASEYFDHSKPNRTSREKMIYLKERKALKTIGVVVCGFVICWLPFFVLYVVEVICDSQVFGSSLLSSSLTFVGHNATTTVSTLITTGAVNAHACATSNLTLSHSSSTVESESDSGYRLCSIPRLLSDIFLWLGYSNSVANPIVYTFYNRDFRRCFKDLLSAGCLRRSVNRRMSVRRLHQTRL